MKCWGIATGGGAGYNAANPGYIGDSPNDMGGNLAVAVLPVGRTAKKIGAGLAATCAILDDDSLYCWNYRCDYNSTSGTYPCTSMYSGGVALGQIPIGSPVQDMFGGAQHACALLKNGQVRCWGANSYGVLGQGDTVNRAWLTSQLSDITSIPNINLGTGRTAIKLSSGMSHVCAILDNQKLKCWGDNLGGELGLGAGGSRGDQPNEMGDNLPYVDVGTGRTVIDVSGGGYFTCALLDNHTVKCWGENPDGRLGQGNKIDPIGSAVGSMGDALKEIPLW